MSIISIDIPYRRKIWQELNLVDWLKPVQTKILADFNLAGDLGTPLRLALAHALQLNVIRVRATSTVN